MTEPLARRSIAPERRSHWGNAVAGTGATTGYSLASRIVGWAIAAMYFAHSVIAVKMPRTDKALELREILREWHFTVGFTLFALAAARLILWARDGAVAPTGAVSANAHGFARLLALTTYVLIFCTAFLGIAFAWTSDHPATFLGVQILPTLIQDNYSVWTFSGYFHSGVSFVMILLNLTALFYATYLVFRYRIGWLEAFPPGYLALAFLAFEVTVYALINTGFSKAPGVEIVAAGAAAVVLISLAWRRMGAEARPA